jgi:predicted DNA-binding protein (MmcQ/YjbR family)
VTYDEFNEFCGSLPAATYVCQWGGSHVWKAGGRVFAIGGWDTGEAAITFKTSELSYLMLADQPGLRPAPYLASRGLKWIQHYAKPGLAGHELRAYIAHSHRMVVLGLSRKKRAELGLDEIPS